MDGARQVDWCFDKPNPESVPVSHHVKWVLVNRCPAATLPLAADAAALAFRRGECRPAATPGLHPPHASGRCERSAGGDCLQAPGASEDGVAAAIDALAFGPPSAHVSKTWSTSINPIPRRGLVMAKSIIGHR